MGNAVYETICRLRWWRYLIRLQRSVLGWSDRFVSLFTFSVDEVCVNIDKHDGLGKYGLIVTRSAQSSDGSRIFDNDTFLRTLRFNPRLSQYFLNVY